MADVQPRMPKLKQVHIDGNFLTPRGYELLLKGLGRACIEDLGDIFKNMGCDMAEAMARGLPNLKGLKRLDLSNNGGVTSREWGALIDALAGMSLEELNISHSALDDEKAQEIAERLPKLRK